MEPQVIGFSHNRQIVNIVVVLITIDMMNIITVWNLTVIVRPNRAMKKNEFEVMPILVLGLAVDDAVELLMSIVDLFDFKSIAVNLVDEILDGGKLERHLDGGAQQLEKFLLVPH